MTLSPRPTASKQNVQNIVMAIDEFSVDNTEYMFAYLLGKKKLPNDSKNKLSLVKFTCPLLSGTDLNKW